MRPLAPTIHPVSSGLQGWGQVLGCHLFVPPSPPLPIVAPWCGDVAISTCDPPHKQWLAGLGVGAGLLFVAWRSCLHVPVPVPVPVTSPPCKQLLAVAGRGGRGGRGGPCSHLAAPLSTLRAVAHGGGWGCCGGGGGRHHGGGGGGGGVVVVVADPPCCHPSPPPPRSCRSACPALPCSTCDSPHKQRLMGVVQGLGLLFDRGMAFVCASPPSPPLPLSCCAVVMWPLAPMIHASSGSQGWGQVLGCRLFMPTFPSPPLSVVAPWWGDVAISTCNPPHEQWLTGLGQVLGCRSWCGVHGVVFIHASHPPFPLDIPPAIHPMSSCSWGWGWVVCHQ
jgi:hypothetical protein